MFTGIVETLGTVSATGKKQLEVSPLRPLAGCAIGESVSVNGVCLTVTRRSPGGIAFGLLPETIRVTTLGKLRIGDRVNLERALKGGDRLGGHLLLGHVDGIGTMTRRSKRGDSLTLEIKLSPMLTLGLVAKGPIAVDGVSLTLDPKIEKGLIRVHLVSHTLEATTLAAKRTGDLVNIELDLIAKYLRGIIPGPG